MFLCRVRWPWIGTVSLYNNIILLRGGNYPFPFLPIKMCGVNPCMNLAIRMAAVMLPHRFKHGSSGFDKNFCHSHGCFWCSCCPPWTRRTRPKTNNHTTWKKTYVYSYSYVHHAFTEILAQAAIVTACVERGKATWDKTRKSHTGVPKDLSGFANPSPS